VCASRQFSTYVALVTISVRNAPQRCEGTTISVAIAVTRRVTSAAGRIRRARRAQNAVSRMRPEPTISSTSSEVIRKPETAKKTSTPT
jgi:hypothetical protein